jgi:hypothetical protein
MAWNNRKKLTRNGRLIGSVRLYGPSKHDQQGIPMRIARATKSGFVIDRSSKTHIAMCRSLFDVCRTVLGGPVKTRVLPHQSAEFVNGLSDTQRRAYNKRNQYMIVPIDFLRLIVKYEQIFRQDGRYAGLSLQEFLMRTWG